MLPISARGGFDIAGEFNPQRRLFSFKIKGPHSVNIFYLDQLRCPSSQVIEKAADLMLNFLVRQPQVINWGGKQVTRCAGEARPNQSDSGLNDEDHSREARPRRKIDLAKPQQADCHLFTAPVNKYPERSLLDIISARRGAWDATFYAVAFAAAASPISPEVHLISSHIRQENGLDSMKRLLQSRSYTTIERWLQEGFLLSLGRYKQKVLFLWICNSPTLVNDLLLFLRHGLLEDMDGLDIAWLIKDFLDMELDPNTVKRVLFLLISRFKKVLGEQQKFYPIFAKALESPHRESLIPWLFNRAGFFFSGEDRGALVSAYPVINNPQDLSFLIQSGLLHRISPEEFAAFFVYVLENGVYAEIDMVLSHEAYQNLIRRCDRPPLQRLLQEAVACAKYVPLSDRFLNTDILDLEIWSFYYVRLLMRASRDNLDAFSVLLEGGRLSKVAPVCFSSIDVGDRNGFLIALFYKAPSFKIIEDVLSMEAFVDLLKRLCSSAPQQLCHPMLAKLLEAAFGSPHRVALVERLLKGGVLQGVRDARQVLWRAFVRSGRNGPLSFFPYGVGPFLLVEHGILDGWRDYATAQERIYILQDVIENGCQTFLDLLLFNKLLSVEEMFFLCRHLLPKAASYHSVALERVLSAMELQDRYEFLQDMIDERGQETDRNVELLFNHGFLKNMPVQSRLKVLDAVHNSGIKSLIRTVNRLFPQ